MILSHDNAQLSRKVGELRTQHGKGKGRGDYLHCEQSPSGSQDVRAAFAECSVALFTGFEWRAFRKRHKSRSTENVPDVGPLEVKSVSSDKHRLILHSAPQMLVPQLLIAVRGSECKFLGWCFGFEVWQDKCWDETLPTPAYARRPEQLYGMASLLAWCQSYDYKIELVDSPRFATGWEVE